MTLAAPSHRLRVLLFAVLAGALYALGLNNYIMPESTDGIMYYTGARSLVDQGTYLYNGKIISDWPPGYPLVLAAFFKVLGTSGWLGKVVSVLSAVLALVLALRLLRLEQRPWVWSTVLIYAVLPTGFLYAVRISADWTFTAMTFAFLLALRRLVGTRSLGLAVGVGILLGVTSLTRYIGVLLGAAIVAQAVWVVWRALQVQRKTWLRALLDSSPEVIAAVVGAAMWLGWQVFLRTAPEGTVAPGLYQVEGAGLLDRIAPLVLFSAAGDYFAQLPDILDNVGWWSDPMMAISGAVIGGMILLGWWRSIRRRDVFNATDWYVLCYLLLIASYEWKLPRFLIPIGPWLILYFLEGGHTILGWLSPKGWVGLRTRAVPVVASLWCAGALVLNGCLIFKGHPSGLHGPLLSSLTKNEMEFYGPFYQDLLKTAHYIQTLPPGARIGTEGFYANYLQAYSSRVCYDPRLTDEKPQVFIKIEDHEEGYQLPEGQWEPIFKAGRVTVLGNLKEITPPQS